MMKSLAHPNIIALHEIIEEENWAYIIEEYCEEGDL
jgi:serine/threonine protein kinase